MLVMLELFVDELVVEAVRWIGIWHIYGGVRQAS